MIRARTILPAVTGLVAALCSAGSAETLRVNGDNVNVRSGPGTTYEVVCQVSRGELLAVHATADDWAEIDPPDSARVWVYGELLNGSTVMASRVQVRCGPGINYRPLGKLDKGTVVSVRETFGEWVKIDPPQGVRLWVSAGYLEPLEPPAVKPPVAAEPAPAVKPASLPAPGSKPAALSTPPGPVRGKPPLPADRVLPGAVVPAALTDRKLDEARTQGEPVEYTGEIERVGWTFGRLSRFRLVRPGKRGRPTTVCYVLGNEEQLKSILGRTVTLEGKAYWVRRVRRPAVMPDRIVVRRKP